MVLYHPLSGKCLILSHYLFIYLSIYLSIYLYLLIYLSIDLSISIYLSKHPSSQIPSVWVQTKLLVCSETMFRSTSPSHLLDSNGEGGPPGAAQYCYIPDKFLFAFFSLLYVIVTIYALVIMNGIQFPMSNGLI